MTIAEQILEYYRDSASDQKVTLPDGFVDAVTDWVTSENHLVTFGTDNFGTFIIVVGHALKGGKEFVYRMIRAFPLGRKWGVSIDHDNLDAEEMMHELLQTGLNFSK